MRPTAFGRLPITKRTIARPYGGKLTHDDVKERFVKFKFSFKFLIVSYFRIVRAFLIEEVK